MRAPGRLSQAALFLVDNKSRSKGLAVQVPLAARLPPQPSDQGLCALPLPRGSADVHHRGSRERRAAAGPERPVGGWAELAEPARGGSGPLPPAETSRQDRPPRSYPTPSPRGLWGARVYLVLSGQPPAAAEQIGESVRGRRVHEPGKSSVSTRGGAASPLGHLGATGPGPIWLLGPVETGGRSQGSGRRRGLLLGGRCGARGADRGPESAQDRVRGNAISFQPVSPSVSCAVVPCVVEERRPSFPRLFA